MKTPTELGQHGRVSLPLLEVDCKPNSLLLGPETACLVEIDSPAEERLIVRETAGDLVSLRDILESV